MKIQEQDIYLGAVLAQIVEHDSFQTLNRSSGKHGRYLVNADRYVFAKYQKKKSSPWVFQFQAHDIQTLRDLLINSQQVFLCLVCGNATICALNDVELHQVLTVTHQVGPQSIRVEIPKGGGCHVRGAGGALARTVPHNSFPDKIFI